jgi:hypothetical protein
MSCVKLLQHGSANRILLLTAGRVCPKDTRVLKNETSQKEVQ